MTQRCGYIALLGRPNAGKSTLLNALVGDKLAVVSRKPQTTRNRILGVALQGKTQILLLDTPGIHKSRRNLINTTMNRVAMATAGEADLLLYLVDAQAGFTDEDATYLQRALIATSAPCILLATKVDALKKTALEAALSALRQAIADFRAEHPSLAERLILSPKSVSAKRPESVKELKKVIARQLPEGPWLFDPDDLTDLPRNFIVGELIREQIFRQLGQEVPYGCAVKVHRIDFKPAMVVVRASIIVSRASHKPIILGKGGRQIKALGTAARESLEQHFDKRVFLDLDVTVAEGWIDDQRLISELAHLADLSVSPSDSSTAPLA